MSKLRSKINEYLAKGQQLLGKSFYHDPVILVMLTVFSLLLVVLLLMLIFQVEPSNLQIPLTYNVLYGVTFSSNWFGIYAYLGAITLIGAINFLVAWAFFEKERLISYLVGCITILLAGLTILYTYNLTALIK